MCASARQGKIMCDCSRPGKGHDWPPKMGRVVADAYLMWPRHVAIPRLHQEHTFQAPYTRAFAGMRLEICRIAPLDATKLRTAYPVTSMSTLGQARTADLHPGTCLPNQKRLAYCIHCVKHCCWCGGCHECAMRAGCPSCTTRRCGCGRSARHG